LQLSLDAVKTESMREGEKSYPMPFTRLEVAVLSVVDGVLQVLLVRRAEDPHKGKWALPGGVLRIDKDPSLDEAALRVARERLGVEVPFLRQLCAVGGPARDKRAPWALSVVYRALVPVERFEPSAGKRIEALAWRPVEEDGSDKGLAFDHAELVSQAIDATRAELDRLELPFGFLPAEFTLGELQAICEQLLGRRLDKSSFRRRLADRDLLEPVPGAMKGGAYRPAQLYRAVRLK
jgi:ADP-ribose pyrophosphatase YjhB (NUDIX family)